MKILIVAFVPQPAAPSTLADNRDALVVSNRLLPPSSDPGWPAQDDPPFWTWFLPNPLPLPKQ